MAVLQDVNINVYAQPSEKRVRTFLALSQNENGRQICFRILGAPLPSNCSATFSGTKPDGTVYTTTGTVTGNFVIVQEDMQMTAVPGVWDANLDVVNGTHNIVTATIRVMVERGAVAPGSVPSNSQLDGYVAQCKSYAEQARTEAYGSPLTAATKSAMTDKTRVYVYTGSEANMTAGNWYYWNGSAWTSGGVYNAVAVQTDKTLTVQDKAADGKATGDALDALKEDLNVFAKSDDIGFLAPSAHDGYYWSNNVLTANALMSCTDLIKIPYGATSVVCGNKTVTAGGTVYRMSPNILFFDGSETRIGTKNNTTDDVAEYAIPSDAVYIKVNQPSKTGIANGGKCSIVFKYSFLDSIAKLSVDYLEGQDVGFLSSVERKYVKQSGEDTNAALSHTDYIRIPDGMTCVEVTNKIYSGQNTYHISPNLVFYDKDKNYIRSAANSVDDVAVYEIQDGAVYVRINQPNAGNAASKHIRFSAKPLEYHVYPPGTTGAKWTSFTALIKHLKYITIPKTIYVHGGTYDIFDEYDDLGATGQVHEDYSNFSNYMPYVYIVPPNTHVIGLGKVTFEYQPTYEETYAAESKIISPLNVSGTATIENIEIVCKNCRYAIHDETLGMPEYIGAIKKYKNVIAKKLINDEGLGFGATIGFGFDTQHFEFDSCEFYNENTGAPFYMHDRTKYSDDTTIPASQSGSINVKNCIIDHVTDTATAILFGNVGASTDLDIRTVFSGCYIKGRVKAGDESNSDSGNNPNSFDMTFIGCNAVNVSIPYANNAYPVRQLNVIPSE